MASKLEELFEIEWQLKYPTLQLIPQYKVLPNRKFKIDFAHLSSKTGIEVQGGRWIKGGHTSGNGMFSDCEKSLLCAQHGWLIIPIIDKMISEEYIEIIYSIIKQRTLLLRYYYEFSDTNSIAV
jgi:hypothetical protein